MTQIKVGQLQAMLAAMVPDKSPSTVDSGDPQMAYNELASNDQMESGVWSCTAGGWPIKSYSVSEVMMMLSGRLRLTAADGTVTELIKGDVFYIPKGWSGRWDTLEDMEKFYVIMY